MSSGPEPGSLWCCHSCGQWWFAFNDYISFRPPRRYWADYTWARLHWWTHPILWRRALAS